MPTMLLTRTSFRQRRLSVAEAAPPSAGALWRGCGLLLALGGLAGGAQAVPSYAR